MPAIELPQNPSENDTFNVNGLFDLVYKDGAWRTSNFVPGGGTGGGDPWIGKRVNLHDPESGSPELTIDLSRGNHFYYDSRVSVGAPTTISNTILNIPQNKAMVFVIQIWGQGPIQWPESFQFPDGPPELKNGVNNIIVYWSGLIDDPGSNAVFIAHHGPSTDMMPGNV